MNRPISGGPPATPCPDNDPSANGPKDVDTREPAAPSLFTLEAGGFAFTFPTDHIAGVRAIREQAIASYRAVIDKQHTDRDIAFLLGIPKMETPACGDPSKCQADIVDKVFGRNNNNPTQPVPEKQVELLVISDGEDEKPPLRSGECTKTRESPTRGCGGRNRGGMMEDTGPEVDAVAQSSCSLPGGSGGGCSRGSEEPETDTGSQYSDRSSPPSPKRVGPFCGGLFGLSGGGKGNWLEFELGAGNVLREKVEYLWPICGDGATLALVHWLS